MDGTLRRKLLKEPNVKLGKALSLVSKMESLGSHERGMQTAHRKPTDTDTAHAIHMSACEQWLRQPTPIQELGISLWNVTTAVVSDSSQEILPAQLGAKPAQIAPCQLQPRCQEMLKCAKISSQTCSPLMWKKTQASDKDNARWVRQDDHKPNGAGDSSIYTFFFAVGNTQKI